MPKSKPPRKGTSPSAAPRSNPRRSRTSTTRGQSRQLRRFDRGSTMSVAGPLRVPGKGGNR